METHSTEGNPERRSGKTNRSKRLSEVIQNLLPNTPSGFCLLFDILIDEAKKRFGKEDVNRALRSYLFNNGGDSKAFNEGISRRKFRLNRTENIDLAKTSHLLSILLISISAVILKNPNSLLRMVIADALPDLLAVIHPSERDAVMQKTALLLYERSRRNKVKKAETPQPANKGDVINEGIIETSPGDTPKIQTPTMVLRVGPPPMVPENQEKVQVPKIVFKPEPIMAPVQEAPELADNPRQFDLSGFLEKENQARLAANRALDPVLPQEAVETSGTETNGEVVKKPTKLNLSGNNYKDESTTQGEMGYMQRSWLHDQQTPPDQNY